MMTAAASCSSGSLTVGQIPDSLTSQTRDGTHVLL